MMQLADIWRRGLTLKQLPSRFFIIIIIIIVSSDLTGEEAKITKIL